MDRAQEADRTQELNRAQESDRAHEPPQVDEAVLHRYQQRLLDLLMRGHEPAGIVWALRADPQLAPLREYIEGLDPHALVVAAELIARWGTCSSE
ncbi:MAG: hypothetical protein AAGF11_49770 [Myxococcota bacterium]